MQKPIDSVTIEDLRGLVANRVSEGRSLEYKEALPGGGSGEKKEFLADVSALANTSGGWILYGIIEERDEDGKPTGVPSEMRGVQGNQDSEMLRLDSIAPYGIEPRIHGLRWRAITLTDSTFVLVCWVPRSLHSPHMVWFEKSSKFWARAASGKYQLDVQQLRASFVASDATRERTRSFLRDRLSAVIAQETPVTLVNGPLAVLHLIPPAAFDAEAGSGLDLAQVLREHLFNRRLEASRYNLDGVLVCDRSGPEAAHYTQVFRTGALEHVRYIGRFRRPELRSIPNGSVEKELGDELARLLHDLRAWGVGGSLLVTLAITGSRVWGLSVPSILYARGDVSSIDRDVLRLPEVWLPEIPDPPDFQAAARVLRAPLDTLWQSAGGDGSPYYNPDGTCSPRN